MSDERRRYSRINYDTPVILEQGENAWDSLVIDISLKGLLIWMPDDWDPTDPDDFKATIPLGGEAVISMTVHQVHSSSGRVGFECSEIDDESITHIRRLLELSLGDSDLIERELNSLG